MFKGFFNRMYGGNPRKPDILPDDMPKNRLELFFACLGVRFMDLIKLNLLFLLFISPLILWTVLSSDMFFGGALPEGSTNEEYLQQILGTLQGYLFGCVPLLVLAGPPCAGLIYCAKRWAMDEHVWLWSDFKDAMKANWKQGMVVMLVFALVLALGFFAVRFYGVMEGQVFGVIQVVLIVLMALVACAYLYIFPLMVNYELRTRDLFRNAFMLAIGRLPFTVLFTALNLLPVVGGILLFTKTFYALLGLVIYYGLLGFGLAAFVSTSYTNATFDRIFTVSADTETTEEKDTEE